MARVSGASAPAQVIAVDDDGAIRLGGAGHIDYVGVVGTSDDADPDQGDDAPAGPAPATARFADGAPAIDARFGGERAVITALAVERGRVVAGLRSLSSPAAFGRIVVWDAAAGGTPVQFENPPPFDCCGCFPRHRGRAVRCRRSGTSGCTRDHPAVGDRVEATTRDVVGGLVGAVTSLDGDETEVVGTDATGVTYRWRLDLDPTAPRATSSAAD